jgi:hypothetical protein
MMIGCYCGTATAGLIRVDALLGNQLSAEPMFLPLPSALTSSFTTTITYTWQGPAHSSETVGYNVLHKPAAAISIADGWYLDLSMERVYTSAQVSVNPSKVVINTRTKRPVTLQVCSIPHLDPRGHRPVTDGVAGQQDDGLHLAYSQQQSASTPPCNQLMTFHTEHKH